MISHPYDRLGLPNGGQLIFTPCPGTKGVDLAASIGQLHNAGASALITMMPDEELAKFEVSALPAVVEPAGMDWFQFPVEVASLIFRLPVVSPANRDSAFV